jgi:uncharacterized protein
MTTNSSLQIGEVGFLKIVSANSLGVFLDWGQPKDLFLPFAEMNRHVLGDDDEIQDHIGEEILVTVYLDNLDRPCASMRIEKRMQKTKPLYKENQEVNLIVFEVTDLGYKALIENKHVGMIFQNEVFKKLTYAQELKGFIRKIRPDGKIDLSLQIGTGHKAGQELAPMILERLKNQNGFLDINDKTPAEKIYEYFGVSKKKYKIAIGHLYTKRLIRIEDHGIYLVTESLGAPTSSAALIKK